jgi:2-keto-3-deoxygluconate permease
MNIYTTAIKKIFVAIPGGIMVIPLLLAMALYTFFPTVFEIGQLTSALFQDGTLTLLGLLFFLVGTQFQFAEGLKVWTNGLILLAYKLFLGIFLYLFIYYFYGLEGVAGITPVVLLIALTQPNIAMFVAITLQFGRPYHLKLLPLLTLMVSPLIIMLVLEMDGRIQASLTDYVSILIPFILGAVVGFFFQERIKAFSKLIPMVIPFFAFSVGAKIHLSVFLQSGFTGILLTLLVLGSGVGGFFLLRLFAFDNATSGIAIGSTASMSIVVLPLLSTMDDRYSPLVPAITSQLITVTVLSCIFCPMIAKYLQRFQRDSTKLMNT